MAPAAAHQPLGSSRTVTDDLGTAVTLPAGPVTRVVSLVPSLTEALAATRRGALIGATDWCTHPADLDVPRVRGTKNPDRRAIESLAPELVVCVQEENRELDVRRLREAGVPVWVGVVESVDDALRVLRTLLTQVLGWDEPGWLTEVERLWGPDDGPRPMRRHVAVPIWRDPWMVVGPDTYTSDLLRVLGLDNVFAGPRSTGGSGRSTGDNGADPDGQVSRYPSVTVDQIDASGADVVLLPDEPYVFTDDDGPEAFTRTPTRLVSGRLLTWYGPAMLEAHQELSALDG
ncbi:helical backbone metal receptor [Ornithinimicrobium pratense]|uniref:Cobalamin-binding protein n=1 Tax=Ornithinimicrobium pratense TaxID=2593973 RepID=A0A5J6V5I6_9MICO|nr:helical backbone metal receptor [Ornithinimicrobium pratense]QFG68272.1 cobalamin-binding protein [Ornithinimicrobium pratense]